MRRPLPPELARIGDALERDVREAVVEKPRKRQLALSCLTSFVITVPLAISLTSAELSRPVSELENQRPGGVRAVPVDGQGVVRTLKIAGAWVQRELMTAEASPGRSPGATIKTDLQRPSAR